MEINHIREQRYIKAQKKVKDIKGFYTHLIATLFVIPFIIFINLKEALQFLWFGFFIAAWFLGLLIHWFIVFRVSKSSLKEDWKQKKVTELMGKVDKSNYTQEQYYIKAKKRTKEIKGFYIHLAVTIFSALIIILVNLKFVPGFYFFWYAVIGMMLALFFNWLGVFGLAKLGLGKDWEKKKIKQIMK